MFHVYTFKNHRCRIGPGVFVTTPFELNAAKGVYCNGAIHWCNRSEFSVYFDVDTQCLKKFPMPQFSMKGFERIYYFGESGGRLHLMLPIITDFHRCDHFDIFELKEDYSGWSLMHRIDLESVQNEFPETIRNNFYIVRSAKDKMFVLLTSFEGAICYNPVDKTLTKLCDFDFDLTSIPIFSSLDRILQHFEHLMN